MSDRLRRLDDIEAQLDAPDLTDQRHHELAAQWAAEMRAEAGSLSPAQRSAVYVDVDKTAASLRSNPPSVKAARAAQANAERSAMSGANPTFEPAGHAVVNQRGHVLDDDGPGAPSAKAAAAISESGYKAAFRSYLRKGLSGLSGSEAKTLQEGIDEQGGFLVPADMASRIIARAPTPTRLASRVTRIPTSRDRIRVPKVNYSADDIYSTGVRVAWTGEVPSSSTVHRVTDPQFGQIGISVYTAMLSMELTVDMVEDAA
ncbi:MAG: phage major capsid protein, partial [Acidimicrobiales bacterium]|nr:phage major capsid protein [Acidimicrobiales bacterium]